MTKKAGVSFRGKSFWVYDVVGGVFLWHLIQAAETHRQDTSIPWLENSIESWRIAAAITELAYFADDNWTQEQTNLILRFCGDAISAIRDHGDFSKAEISTWQLGQELRIFTRGLDPVPSEPVVRFGEALVLLLKEELPAPPELHWWFYGTEDSPKTIKMLRNYDDPDYRNSLVR